MLLVLQAVRKPEPITEEERRRLHQGTAKRSKYIQVEQTSELRVCAKQGCLAGNFSS